MKKLFSIILGSLLIGATCSSMNTFAAFDNNGNYRANEDYHIKSYSTAHDHFKDNYGWGENSEYFNLYQNGTKVANHICIFNPEMIGDEYACSWVGASDHYGYYADNTLTCNGSGVMSNTTYLNGSIKNNNCSMYCDNDKNVTFLGNIYWD